MHTFYNANKIIILKLILLLLLFILNISCIKKIKTNKNTIDDIYKDYNFDEKNVIYFGTQPLAVPTGVIPEILKHDQILITQLNGINKKLEVKSFYKGKDINHFLLKNKLNLAVAGDMPVLTAASKNKIIAAAIAKQSFSSIICKEQILLNELKNKKIGIAAGSTSHYVLLDALNLAGLEDKDVNIIPMNINKMITSMETGKIDAFSAWEPTPTIAIYKHPEWQIIHRTLSTSYLYFSKDFLENNQEASNYILAAYVRAILWMKSDKNNLESSCRITIKEAEKFSKTTSILPLSLYIQIINNDLLRISPIALIPENDLEENGRIYNEFLFLQNQNKIIKDASWENVKKSFDNTYLKTVINNADLFLIENFKYTDILND